MGLKPSRSQTAVADISVVGAAHGAATATATTPTSVKVGDLTTATRAPTYKHRRGSSEAEAGPSRADSTSMTNSDDRVAPTDPRLLSPPPLTNALQLTVDARSRVQSNSFDSAHSHAMTHSPLAKVLSPARMYQTQRTHSSSFMEDDNRFAELERQVATTQYLTDDLALALGYLQFLTNFVRAMNNVSDAHKELLSGRLDFISRLLTSQSVLQIMATHDEQLGFQRNLDGLSQLDRELAEFLSAQFQPSSHANARGGRAPVSLAGTAAGVRFAVSLSRLVVEDDTLWQQLQEVSSSTSDFSMQEALADLDSWSFNIWNLVDLAGPNTFLYMGFCMFRGYQFFDHERSHVIVPFLRKMQAAYMNNPYHNSYHAADVAQSVHCFLRAGLIADFQVSPTECLAVLVSCLIHDLGHPGVNNNFLINTSDQLAIRYNDLSVLENFHVSEAFRIMNEDPAADITRLLSPLEVRAHRQLIIKCVLGTDMVHHFNGLADLKAQVLGPLRNSLPVAPSTKGLVLMMAVHTADVSNPAKPSSVYQRWTDRVMSEFFAQGDQEKARHLVVSPFMDRETTQVGKCQLGFIDFIVEPLFQEWAVIVRPLQEEMLSCIAANRALWVTEDMPSLRPTISQPRALPTMSHHKLVPPPVV